MWVPKAAAIFLNRTFLRKTSRHEHHPQKCHEQQKGCEYQGTAGKGCSRLGGVDGLLYPVRLPVNFFRQPDKFRFISLHSPRQLVNGTRQFCKLVMFTDVHGFSLTTASGKRLVLI